MSILNIPEWVGSERPTCEVDDEIVEDILNLWAHEIPTLGCCSGHGITPPSVVVPDLASAIHSYRLLPDWDILIWRLTKYKPDAVIGSEILDFIISQSLVTDASEEASVLIWADDTNENLAFVAKQQILGGKE